MGPTLKTVYAAIGQVIQGVKDKLDWTTLKEKRLIELAGVKKAEEIAKELGTSEMAIRLRAHKLKVSLMMPVEGKLKWTADKVNQLKELAGKIEVAEIARELGVTEKAIRLRAYKLKISLKVRTNHEYCLYKGDEVIFVGTIPEIARHWGVSEETIRHYATPKYKKRIEGKNNRVAVWKI